MVFCQSSGRVGGGRDWAGETKGPAMHDKGHCVGNVPCHQGSLLECTVLARGINGEGKHLGQAKSVGVVVVPITVYHLLCNKNITHSHRTHTGISTGHTHTQHNNVLLQTDLQTKKEERGGGQSMLELQD